eukprot:GHVS01096833.1.p1 GENE.GHVS01096833.1~~GHVS01096833.1.p1  ORF type:complete len:267 (-),score=48.99 GHVS01096833.1:170-886(-)
MSVPSSVVLHGYYRSSSAYRLRIALNAKQIAYSQVKVDLLSGEHTTASYAAINPHKKVPTLVLNGKPLCQSPAILEYLEEAFPIPSLLPIDLLLRQKVREIMCAVACDISPVQNLRVLNNIRDMLHNEYSVDMDKAEARKGRWAKEAIEDGLSGVESVLLSSCKTSTTAGDCYYCVGDNLTMADVCLIPQVYNAYRWGVDVALEFPICHKIYQFLNNHNIHVREAHPDMQPDAPKTKK